MSETPQGLLASAGWAVMHLLYRVDRARWRSLGDGERAAAIAEFSAWLDGCLGEEGLQLIPFVGVTKCDLGFMAVHPDLWRVQ